MMNAKKGISAKQIQRDIEVTYKTAWSMAMRVRQAMHDDSIMLEGIVEIDETFVGGKPRKMANPDCLTPKKRKDLDERIGELEEKGFEFEKGTRWVACDKDVKRGRGSQKKIPIVGMVQRDGDVVAMVMRDLSQKKLTELVQKHVDTEKSVVISDSYKGYSRLNRIVESIKIDHKHMYSYEGVHTNTIESFWAIVKRGIIGQYHQVSLKYLPLYVSEFVYKYNGRNETAHDNFKGALKDATKKAEAA